MSRVAVLLPTKGRAAQMSERVGALLLQPEPQGVRLRVYLAVDETDAASTVAALNLASEYPQAVIVYRKANTTAVEGWNQAWSRAYSDGVDWFVLGADDLIWHKGWLQAAIDAADETGAHVIGLADGYTDLTTAERATHFMVSRWFCDEVLHGYIPAEYRAWRFDREICLRARALNMYAIAPNALLEHMHPAVGKGQVDDTYREAQPHHDADLEVLTRRMADMQQSIT